jgi:hypothetical protein
MDKIRHISWAELSEDESSDTEVESPLIDPQKQILIDSLKSSTFSSFQFKLENLPYTINKSSDILLFFDMPEEEASIRLQYKGQKFSGVASVSVFNKNAALKIAYKYGTSLNGRPILIFYKPFNSDKWIPQKKNLKKVDSFSTDLEDSPFSYNAGQRIKSFTSFSSLTPEQVAKRDPAILKVVRNKRSKTGICHFLFK